MFLYVLFEECTLWCFNYYNVYNTKECIPHMTMVYTRAFALLEVSKSDSDTETICLVIRSERVIYKSAT